jgi:hypothetical protein
VMEVGVGEVDVTEVGAWMNMYHTVIYTVLTEVG